MASISSGSIPSCKTFHPMARYRPPVSRYKYPKRAARDLAALLFPTPDGPSMVIIKLREGLLLLCVIKRDPPVFNRPSGTPGEGRTPETRSRCTPYFSPPSHPWPQGLPRIGPWQRDDHHDYHNQRPANVLYPQFSPHRKIPRNEHPSWSA